MFELLCTLVISLSKSSTWTSLQGLLQHIGGRSKNPAIEANHDVATGSKLHCYPDIMIYITAYKTTLYCLNARRKALLLPLQFVRPSVCHTRDPHNTVQGTERRFELSDTILFDDSSRQMSWFTPNYVLNRCTQPISSEQIDKLAKK